MLQTRVDTSALRRAIWALMLVVGPLWTTGASTQTTSNTTSVKDRGNLLSHCPSVVLNGSTPCEYTDPEPLPYLYTLQYYIPVPQNASFDLAITVVSNRGDVDIWLYGPDKSLLSSSEERIGEDVVLVRRTTLSRAPGNYTLIVEAVAQSMSEYLIRIQTTVTITRLAANELAVMAAIAAQCCSPDDDMLPDACTRLNAAIAPNATADNDMCNMPPNMCNSQGQLTKLVLSGGDKGNFVCPSLPAQLGQLTALQVLDWTSNSQVGTLDSVAAVLAPLAGTLKRLYMGRNALSGPLGCSLASQTSLEILRLERNLLSGTVPACMLEMSSLRQLSLSGNLLGGAIPALPPGCGLVQLDLSENGPPLGASATNAGFTGLLPQLTNAANLSQLVLHSNSLSGTIPPLPSGLQVFKAGYNRLVGPLPPSLDVAADLRVLDLSHNQLTGTLSRETTNNELLTVLRLADNRLSGELPFSSWGSFLMDVDLSENNFTGKTYSQLLFRPSLINLNLAFNGLAFNIEDVANNLASTNAMLYFNISNNNVYGELTSNLGKMRMFNKLLLQVSEDEALQGTMPPQPLFDISNNKINSTFPLSLLPLLGALYFQSPYNYIPFALKLQPQKPGFVLYCPPSSTPLPDDIFYMNELQGLYNLTCQTSFGLRMNISSYQDTSLQPSRPNRPPKPPAPPRPPPPSPPRSPRRRPPPSNTTGNTNTTTTTDSGAKGPPPPRAGMPMAAPTPTAGVPAAAKPAANGVDGAAAQILDPGTGTSQLPSTGTEVSTVTAGKKGSSTGAVAGGIVAGVLVVVAVVVGVVLYRRYTARRGNYTTNRRVPLTFNASYEAPSEGTASNYADMQMFEFKADRATRQRMRMQ